MDVFDMLIAVLSALLGGGGVAAYERARGQNRVDLYNAAGERIIKLEQRADDLDKRNDDLITQNANLLGQVGSLHTANEQLSKRLETQRVLIDELQVKVARVTTLEEENARLRQQIQIEQAKREFLEREVNALRMEIARLRARIGNDASSAGESRLHNIHDQDAQ